MEINDVLNILNLTQAEINALGSVDAGTIVYNSTTNSLESYNGTIWVSAGGETNTASNIGTGTDVFKQKTGVDLEFRKINSTELDVTQNTNDITLSANSTLISGLSGCIYLLTLSDSLTTVPSSITLLITAS